MYAQTKKNQKSRPLGKFSLGSLVSLNDVTSRSSSNHEDQVQYLRSLASSRRIRSRRTETFSHDDFAATVGQGSPSLSISSLVNSEKMVWCHYNTKFFINIIIIIFQRLLSVRPKQAQNRFFLIFLFSFHSHLHRLTNF